MSSEVIVGKSRPVEPEARLYKHLCQSDCFGYKSWLDGWMLMILTYKIDIYETKKLTEGQGHKVGGQGKICNLSKILFRLKIMNEWLDLDDSYTND